MKIATTHKIFSFAVILITIFSVIVLYIDHEIESNANKADGNLLNASYSIMNASQMHVSMVNGYLCVIDRHTTYIENLIIHRGESGEISAKEAYDREKNNYSNDYSTNNSSNKLGYMLAETNSTKIDIYNYRKIKSDNGYRAFGRDVILLLIIIVNIMVYLGHSPEKEELDDSEGFLIEKLKQRLKYWWLPPQLWY